MILNSIWISKKESQKCKGKINVVTQKGTMNMMNVNVIGKSKPNKCGLRTKRRKSEGDLNFGNEYDDDYVRLNKNLNKSIL